MKSWQNERRAGNLGGVALPDLDLTPERRDRVVRAIRTALESAIHDSLFVLRGSLADGTADPYSDIDAAWLVPDGYLPRAVDQLEETLVAVGQLASVRVDPSASSESQCLVFVAFADLPVFWRFDLVIEASSVSGSLIADKVLEGYWSLPESALANAVAAIKAVVRGRIDDARDLLERGYPRVGEAYQPSASWRADVVQLARLAARVEPSLAGRADEVQQVAVALLSK